MNLQQCVKLTAAIVFCVAISRSSAEQGHDDFGSAIDARGVRYVGKSSGGPAPWLADALFGPKPDYPYSERRLHHEGVAVFRLDIDLKTGTTTKVTMIQSSGFPKLDDVSLNCVRRWRWRPGKWKQVEVPVVFTLSPLRPGETFHRTGPPPA
jgi:TonB family protein